MKTLIAVAALAAALSTSAFAAPGDNPQRRMQYIDNGGTLHELDIHNTDKIALFKKSARELPPGTLVMTVDGHIYVLQDSKLPNGQMMSDTMMN